MGVSKPFFSVIIPTYNSQRVIGACIESLLSQTCQDFEILILDGFSTDDTGEIVKGYSSTNTGIRWFSEKDEGIYDAMNKGIAKAKGEWLYFLGSDDTLVDKEVLKDVSKHLETSNCEIIYGEVLFKKQRITYDGEYNLSKLLKEKNICHQAIFYNAGIFKLIGKFNLRYPILADYDFNLRCFKHPEFVIKYIPRTIAVYNDVDGISALADPAMESFLKEIPLKREEMILKLEKQIKVLRNSFSYRLGFFLLKPVRFLKGFFR